VFKCLLIADICFSVGLLIFSRADFSVNTDFSILANFLILTGVVLKSFLYKFKPITSATYSNVTINAVFLHMIISISSTMLVFRVVPLFCNFANATLALLVISGSSALYFSLLAVVQKNIRKITDLAALSTIAVALFLHTLGFYSIAKAALFVHLFIRATLILLTENIVKTMSGETDISKMGGLKKITPTLTYMAASILVLFLLSLSFIDGMISSPIIESLIQAKNTSLLLTYSGFFVITFVYITRLFMLVFFGGNTSPEQVIAHIKEPSLSLSNLLLVSFFAASYILFFSLDTVLENKGKVTELSLLARQVKFAVLLICLLAAILAGFLVNLFRGRQKTRKAMRIKTFLFEEINFGFITNISVFIKKYLLILLRKNLNRAERVEKFLKKTVSYTLNEICFNSGNAMLSATILSIFILISFFILSSPDLIFKD
jgi:NADH:ubiquinone oxidoreductase subunit 5 (subunit L)/multisubunit Na+/H+ antiporter MnhA subunit